MIYLKRHLTSWVAIPVVMALVLALALPLAVYAAPDDTITLTRTDDGTPYATVDVGATFSLRVAIDTISSFDACDYKVNFDSAVLTLSSVDDGLIGGVTVPRVALTELDGGEWKVVDNIGGTGGASGSGYFNVLNFTVIGADATNSDITLSDGTVSSTSATEIDCTWPAVLSVTVDLLEVTAIGVVGEGATSEGYVSGDDTTTFIMTPTVSGGTGAGTYIYAWTFGDDGSGSTTVAAPSDVTYSSTGGKTIDLAVTDALSSDSTGNEASGTATVYDTLVAGFSGTPLEGIKGSTLYPPTVGFADATAGGKTGGYTYDWDYGDSTTHGTTANPSHEYAPSGTKTGLVYTVSLTADDALAATDDETKTDYVTIYQMGDINEDLTVAATDITEIELIVGEVSGHGETLTCDANEDTNVNSIDITQTEILVAAATD